MAFFVSGMLQIGIDLPPPENHTIPHTSSSSALATLGPARRRGARAATDGRLSARCGTVLATTWSDEAHLGLYPCVRAMVRMMVCGMLLSGGVCRIEVRCHAFRPHIDHFSSPSRGELERGLRHRRPPSEVLSSYPHVLGSMSSSVGMCWQPVAATEARGVRIARKPM